jgi:hypothetical protein
LARVIKGGDDQDSNNLTGSKVAVVSIDLTTVPALLAVASPPPRLWCLQAAGVRGQVGGPLAGARVGRPHTGPHHLPYTITGACPASPNNIFYHFLVLHTAGERCVEH